MRSWGLAQRVIVVIALALGFAVLGRYLVSLGHPRVTYGWFSYAPLSSKLSVPPPGMRPWERALIWIGLIGVWAGASAWLLRPPRTSAKASGTSDER